MAMILRVLIVEGVLAATLFASAGRIDLPWFWAVLAVHSALLTVGMPSIDTDLRRERHRPGPGGARRKLEFDTAQFAEAVHERLEHARGLAGLGDRVGEDGANFGFHRPAVAGGPDAEPFLHFVIEVSDTECGQRDHSLPDASNDSRPTSLCGR